MLHRALERHDQRIELDRLGEEVVGPCTDGADGRLEAPECGDDEHRHVGPARHHPLAQIEPVHPTHVEVGHDDVDVGVAQRRQRHGRVGVALGDEAVGG